MAAALLLGGLMLLAFAVRSWLNTKADAPWIFGDELTYSEMAKSFAAGHGFEVRGAPPNTRTLYPVVISPAWLIDSVQSAFVAAKAINTALMTLACVPLYLWARRLVSVGFALVAAALLLLLPAFAYTGTIMTENAFLPLFVLALYVLARALETPTLVWQLSAVALTLPAVAVRVQGLVLLAVLVTAIILDSLVAAWSGEKRLRSFVARLRRFTATGVALILLAAAYLAYALVSYDALSQGLGGYSGLAQLDFSLWNGLRWTVFTAGELVLAVAFLPACAFILLASAWLRPSARPAERAFASVSAAALLWVVPMAGFYASRYSQRIEERNMFYLEPLLLLALVTWVARGAPRPPRWTAVAVAIPAALLAAIPLERLLNISIVSDTFALIPVMRLTTLVEGGTDSARVLLALGAAAAAVLLVVVPQRLASVTIAAVVVFLGLSAWSVAGTLRDQSHATGLETGAEHADWIDDAVGSKADVPIVFTLGPGGQRAPVMADRVLEPVGGRRVRARLGRSHAHARRTDDHRQPWPLRPHAEWATACAALRRRSAALAIDGEKVAAEGRFVLYRVRPPLKVKSPLDGVYPDGWSGPNATYTNYTDQPGTVRVDVGRAGWGGPDAPGLVTIDVERIDSGRRVSTARWVVHSGSQRTFRLRAPGTPFRVKVGVQPTFSPATYGFGDARQLGAQLAFAFEPRSQSSG